MKSKKVASEEIVDIIENIPDSYNKIILYGLLLIFGCIVGLGFLINYPDVIKANVVLQAANPPVKLVAKSSGSIKILKEKGSIKKDEYIAYLENTSSFSDVMKLKEKIANFDIKSNPDQYNNLKFEDPPNLGSLEQYYYSFLNTYHDYLTNNSTIKQNQQINYYKGEIRQNKLRLSKRWKIIESKKEEITLLGKQVRIDSILYRKKKMSEIEYDNSKLGHYQLKEQLSQLVLGAIADSLNINKLVYQLDLLKDQTTNEAERLRIATMNSYRLLDTQIFEWDNLYVFKSNYDGVLEFMDHFNTGQFIKAGQEVFSVIPTNTKYQGYAYLDAEGAGKVEKGQKAIIKLDSYPYLEFGYLEGYISKSSLISNDGKYLNVIKLDNELISNHGNRLNFSEEMSGQAEIITEERKLVGRVYDKLRYIFD